MISERPRDAEICRDRKGVRVHGTDPHEVVAARPPGVGVLETSPHIVRERFQRRVALALASTFDGVEVAAVLAACAMSRQTPSTSRLEKGR